MVRAVVRGEPPVLYGDGAPDCAGPDSVAGEAAQAIRQLWDRVAVLLARDASSF
jgi:hypothetical protein